MVGEDENANGKVIHNELDDDVIDRKLDQLDAMTDRFLGPIESMDQRKISFLVPEVAAKGSGYFEGLALQAAERAALSYQSKGEPIPPHVRDVMSRLEPRHKRASSRRLIEKGRVAPSLISEAARALLRNVRAV